MFFEEKTVTWGDFCQIAEDKKSNDILYYYRGLSSKSHQLQTTLGRVLSNLTDESEYVFANRYFQLLKEHEPEIKQMVKGITLPRENPFKVAMMVGDENHENEFKKLFDYLITLRHHGYPSPLLDWSKDPFMSAGFALKGEPKEDFVIFRLKYQWPTFDPFNRQLYGSVYVPDAQSERHHEQNSFYTIILEHDHTDTLQKSDRRKGPKFILTPYDLVQLDTGNSVIEKFIIAFNDIKEVKKDLTAHKIDPDALPGAQMPLDDYIKAFIPSCKWAECAGTI